METEWKESIEANTHLTQDEIDYFDSQENIFYNAKFGDVFIDAKGNRALYVGEKHGTYICALEDNIDDYSYYDADGHNQDCKCGDESFSIIEKLCNRDETEEEIDKWVKIAAEKSAKCAELETINENLQRKITNQKMKDIIKVAEWLTNIQKLIPISFKNLMGIEVLFTDMLEDEQ